MLYVCGHVTKDPEMKLINKVSNANKSHAAILYPTILHFGSRTAKLLKQTDKMYTSMTMGDFSQDMYILSCKTQMSLTCLLTGGAELKMTSFKSVMRSRSSGFGGPPSISADSGLGVDFSGAVGGLAVGGSNRSYFRTRLKKHTHNYLNSS